MGPWWKTHSNSWDLWMSIHEKKWFCIDHFWSHDRTRDLLSNLLQFYTPRVFKQRKSGEEPMGEKSKITQPSKSQGNRFLLVVVGYPNPFYIVSRFYRPSSMSATFVHHKKKLTNLEQHVLDMLMLFICCFRLVSHFSPMQVERVKVFTSFYVFETNVAAVTCKKYQQL